MVTQWKRYVASLALAVISIAGPAQTSSLSPSQSAFRDSVDTPPPGWTGPRFKLSHDYPKSKPTCAAPWLKRPVSFSDKNPTWDEWKAYVQDIINYVEQGQDPNLADQAGWRTVVGNETRWYHVPWMATDVQRGREFAHGLTNELSTAQSTFREGRGSGKERLLNAATGPNGVDPLFETWSVGMYNPCGAWALGQVFPASGEPSVHMRNGRPLADGLPFPEGTVVMKILNTTADASSVAYLKGSNTWNADGHVQLSPVDYSTCGRQVRKVHLVQIDLAVVDNRSPTRWVYSTLAYNGDLPGATVLTRMQPLGVQWGNDPGSFPAVPSSDAKPVHQTVLAPTNMPQHYGCNRRLAGTVDQSNSSCTSCHMGAYAAPPPYLDIQGVTIPAIFSFAGLCSDFNADSTLR